MDDNRLRDRGTIKWTSMMLPEHVKMLKEVWKEDERVERGMLAEDQAAEIDFKLHRAWNDHLTVEIKYHNGFDYNQKKVKIKSVDRINKRLNVVDQSTKHTYTIRLRDVTEVFIV